MTTATTEIIRADIRDLGDVSAVLGRAFRDDPVFAWVVQDADRRPEVLPAIFGLFAEAFVPHGVSYLASPRSGAALWTPPGVLPVPDEEAEVFGERLAGVVGDDAPRAFEVMELMEAAHPEEPSYYLGFVGVVPERQGHGIGSALLDAVLDGCDTDGAPAYLEATSPDNRRLYERHGFVTVGEIRLPDGPSMWPMWRDPRERAEGV